MTVEAIMEKHMPDLPDLEVLHVGHKEWHIQDWRSLEKKTFSDYWRLGDYKWFVPELILGVL